MTRLTGRLSEVVIGEGHPLVLVNDQLRVMDQSPAVLARLKAGDLTGLVELARRGQERGMHMVDILVSHPDLDEADLLPAAAAAIRDALGCPVALDSRDPAALEAALKALHPGKALINSITAESDCLSALLPLAKDFGAAMVGMPIGHLHGLPQTVQGRLEEAAVILDAAAKFGIPREDVILDAICMAPATLPEAFDVTMQTLRAFKTELGTATILGIGNAGHGMPEPLTIDLAYLLAAVPWGLDAALVNPNTPNLGGLVRAVDFLTQRDAWGKAYIQDYRSRKRAQQTQAESEK